MNYNKEDPNYDMFKLACRVSAKRLFPNFAFLDAPYNLQYYKPSDYRTEIAYMGCRTRVIGNVYDPSREICNGRGNLSFTSINPPRIAIKAKGDIEVFFEDLDRKMDLVIDQLNERFEIMANKTMRNFPFLMGEGVWIDSEKLGWTDSVREGRIPVQDSLFLFDPNTIADDWDTFVSDDSDSSVLLNRATQGLYPPGSTFKIFTTLEYIHENADYADYHFDCSGEYTVGTKTIHCHNNKRHGSEDLKTSFANSCNSSYASLGLTLDLEQFDDLCDQMLFNTALPTDFESSKSSFVLEPGDSDSAVMETSIGQGKTLVTPFHMALIASAIANDGVLMKPYVIDHITDAEGEVVEQYEPAEYKTLLSESDASVLQEYMRYVVEEGTATKLRSDSYEAAGKTGSAEFSSSSDATHSWFVGYAHNGEEPDIAVAVIVENSGVGSEYAVPIAKQIFDAYYTWEN